MFKVFYNAVAVWSFRMFSTVLTGGGAAPGPSDQSAFTSKEGTPATDGPPKSQREPKSRSQRPPASKRSEGKAKETMVNGTSV